MSEKDRKEIAEMVKKRSIWQKMIHRGLCLPRIAWIF